MKIRFYTDGSICAQGLELPEPIVLNSTNSSLAPNDFVRALCELVPYAGAMDGVVLGAEFDSETALIKAHGLIITPESDLSQLPGTVAVFCNGVYSYNRGEYAAKWKDLNLAVHEYEMEEFTDYRSDVVDGKEVIVEFTNTRPKVQTKLIPVVRDDGEPVLGEDGMPKMIARRVRVEKKKRSGPVTSVIED